MTNTDSSNDHSSYYILNREYFTECFDESSTPTGLKAYRQGILFILVACVLFAMKIEAYVAWFLLALGGVELLSIRYKRGWWVTRQMLSRSAGSKVNIRINDQGIFTDSPHHQQSILWSDVSEIKSTEKGFVIIHDSGSNYLSRSGLDEDFLELLAEKSIAINYR